MHPRDHQLEDLVEAACSRIQSELKRYAPFMSEKVSAWMARLSPTGKAPDYFLQPQTFPFLPLPLWAAKSFANETEGEFLADVIYSTVNGYYYIRLLDNLMDGHGTIELKILPATAFFHSEFQATYQKYFDAGHPFWEVFRSAWLFSNDAVAREMDMDRIDPADFEQITVAKLAGVRIPLAAVGFHYGACDRLHSWEEFALVLARWSQQEDDLFDWDHDLRHGKSSHFLTEARRRKGSDTIEGWILREGFEEGMKALERELSALRRWAAPLNSAAVMRYLECRQAMLEEQKATIGAAFDVLKQLAGIMQGGAPQDRH
jgi:hypothetical protein